MTPYGDADDYTDAVEILRKAKHRLVPNGRNLRDEREVATWDPTHSLVIELGWRWLNHSEQHLVGRLDQYLRGDAKCEGQTT